MRGVNSAAEVVAYCKAQPVFREVNMKKYLAASTTRREFFHVTSSQVESPPNLKIFKNRSVSTLEGKGFKLGTIDDQLQLNIIVRKSRIDLVFLFYNTN